jgi:hypothetical protein
MATSAQYQRAARRAARQYNLPFFVRQIRQESGFRDVRSPMGAQGPAQLMPGTARSLGVDPHGKRAIWAAARLMRGYVDKYGVEGALRAYNAGPGAIQASHGYAETNAYVRNILRGGNGGTSAGAGGVPGAAGTPGTPGTVIPGVAGAQNLPQGSEGILALVKALQPQPAPVTGGTLQPPKATAGPAMPQGYQPPQSGGGPAPKVDTDALLESIRTVGGDVQMPAGTPGSVISGLRRWRTSSCVRSTGSSRQSRTSRPPLLPGGHREHLAADGARGHRGLRGRARAVLHLERVRVRAWDEGSDPEAPWPTLTIRSGGATPAGTCGVTRCRWR